MAIRYNDGTNWNLARRAWRNEGTEWAPLSQVDLNMYDPFVQLDPPQIWQRVFKDTPAIPPVTPHLTPSTPTIGYPPGPFSPQVIVGVPGTSFDWECDLEVRVTSTGITIANARVAKAGGSGGSTGSYGYTFDLTGYEGTLVRAYARFVDVTPLGFAVGPYSGPSSSIQVRFGGGV